MQSSEMSLMSGTIKFSIYSLLGKAIRKLCFAENLVKIGVTVLKISFCVAENNKMQNEFHIKIGCTKKSIFPTYDSFCLITSHFRSQLD